METLAYVYDDLELKAITALFDWQGWPYVAKQDAQLVLLASGGRPSVVLLGRDGVVMAAGYDQIFDLKKRLGLWRAS